MLYVIGEEPKCEGVWGEDGRRGVGEAAANGIKMKV